MDSNLVLSHRRVAVVARGVVVLAVASGGVRSGTNGGGLWLGEGWWYWWWSLVGLAGVVVRCVLIGLYGLTHSLL